jgi:hypothetical protein
MPLATKNNAIILKDGRLAENCACCGDWVCVGDACEATFTYGPVAPHYKGSADCPRTACDGTGSCLGLVLEGYLNGPKVGYACAFGKQPKAFIVNATLDNSGSIGSAFANYPPFPTCPVDVARMFGRLVDAEVVDDPSGCLLMRVPFSVTNGPGGGPYGVFSATIRFFFE